MSGGQDGDAGASRAPPLAIAGTASTPPRLLPLGFFFVAYLLGAGLANRLSLHPETSLAIWAPAGLYLAALVLAPPRQWAWWAAVSFGAELVANALWFHQPVGVAVLVNAGNALAAIAGAALLLRLDPAVARLASLRSVLLLVVIGALGAQVLAATMGAATLAWSEGAPFPQAWAAWWVGDATGAVFAAPAVLVAVQAWRDRDRLTRPQVAEALLVALVLGATAVITFSGNLPLVYLVLPPLLWAAVRFEFLGAVASLVLLAFLAVFYTARGSGPFAADPLWQAQKYVMLQLFLAIAGVTTLVVAAIARQHRHALRRLEDARDDLERRVAERTAALSASEQRFRAMADNLPLMVWVHDREGRQEFVNRTFCEYFGVDSDSMRDARWRSYLHPDDEGRYTAAFLAAVRAQGPFHAEVRVRNARDQLRWVESWGRPHFDERGAFLGHVGTSADITDRKAAEQALQEAAASLARERERLGVALRAGALGVYEWSARDGNVWWSPETYALYGVDPATFTPTVESVTALIHPDDREAFWRKSAEQVARREVFVHEYRIVRPDGAVRWIFNRSHAAVDVEGNVERVTGVASDVTARKEVEQALAVASRAKDEFLAMLAHELRNPLAPIRNAADLIRLAGDGNPLLAQARQMIERQVAHMVRLVDDLLDVSRIARGKLRLQRGPVDVNTVVRQVIEAHGALLEARAHQLVLSLPGGRLLVEGDFTRLAQAVGNLVANATKYTDPGGRIDISVEAGRMQDRACALIRVRDSGRGIAPEAMEHLFEMFYQAESQHDRAEGGLGIGLALVKRLVEMHGGSVEARSEGRGHGSEFTIRLPLLGHALEEAPPRDMRSPAPVRPQRVLVVDDNRDAAESTALLLRMDGHEVHTAYDGRAAVEVALRVRPSAVLLDLGLPLLNGYQACRAMREGGLADALIVAVTGHGQDQDLRAAGEAGFDAHRVKPVDLAALRALLAAGRVPATAGIAPTSSQFVTSFRSP